jgi:acyl-coenzyme A synthetase/AMP-(fatty) acid ligase
MGLWGPLGQLFYWTCQHAGCEINYLPLKEIRNLAQYAPTFVTAFPDLLKIVANLSLKDLRFVRSAGAPLSPGLYNTLQHQFSTPVIEAFGCTESLGGCFTNPLNGEQRPGTIGLPLGVEVDIRDGRLLIRGPTLYCKGWYDTGDLADQDEAGYYRILGRSRDQINVRSYKLNPISLEAQLRNTFSELQDCAVFGTDSVKCLYVGAVDENDVENFLLSLGPQCRPSVCKSVQEIPMSSSGKLSRNFLNTLY